MIEDDGWERMYMGEKVRVGLDEGKGIVMGEKIGVCGIGMGESE